MARKPSIKKYTVSDSVDLILVHYYIYYVVEEATVRVRFLDSTKVYTLAWVELLTMEEMPFERYEDLVAGVEVMAPWQDRQGNLQYAEALVLSEENVRI